MIVNEQTTRQQDIDALMGLLSNLTDNKIKYIVCFADKMFGDTKNDCKYKKATISESNTDGGNRKIGLPTIISASIVSNDSSKSNTKNEYIEEINRLLESINDIALIDLILKILIKSKNERK